jgi:hypothetical protein
MTFGDPTLRLVVATSALIASISSGVSAWAAPYALRVLKMGSVEVGLSLGFIVAVASGSGIIFGGFAADVWRRRDVRAPSYMGMIGLLGPLPGLIVMLLTRNHVIYLLAYTYFCFVSAVWSGAFSALAQSLVLLRMRGSTAAIQAIVTVLISAGLGPYLVGKVSVVTGSLPVGIGSMIVMAPFGFALLFWLARRLPTESHARRLEIARVAGEPEGILE